jgi:hypothetical protein
MTDPGNMKMWNVSVARLAVPLVVLDPRANETHKFGLANNKL